MIHLPARVRTASAVFGALLLAACSDLPERLTAPTSPTSSQTLFASQRSEDVRAAIATQERHTPALRRIKGVIGTAVGLGSNGRAVVQVFVVDNGPRDIPAELDGIPTQVKVTGLVMALSNPLLKARPAPLGYSIGHPAITAGTLGARVVNSVGLRFILSNNHVLANSNNASIGDPALQPGPFDGGTLADQIGTLAAFRALNFSGSSNLIDAAIARSDDADNSTPTDDGYGTPNSQLFDDSNNDRIIDDRTHLLGAHVQKYGRTTKLTHAVVTGINATLDVCYEVQVIFCVKSAHFIDQIVIASSGFSGGGDSGSLIVTDDANKNPLGLLFAGSSTETIANRIDHVLNILNVWVDGSATEPPTPVTDAAINSVSAPGSVTQGDVVNVSVQVRNVGNQSVGAFDVSLNDQTDNVAIGTQSVSGLAAGATVTLTFPWNTAVATLGAHTLAGSHTLADDNAGNNSATATVQVNPFVPVTDVAVNSVSAPGSATQGATINVSVQVRNAGNQAVGAFDVSLADQTDNVAIGTQSVSGLAPGATATLVFPWNTTTASLGAHTLAGSQSLTDDNAANNSATATVQVNPFVPTVDIHVGDLDGSASRNGPNRWSATVEVTVHNTSHAPLNGVTVVGTWSPSGLASDTCTTGELGGNGTCIFLFPSIKQGTSFVTFTVTSVTMSGKTYQAAQNHDPDGSSNGTTQRVNRP